MDRDERGGGQVMRVMMSVLVAVLAAASIVGATPSDKAPPLGVDATFELKDEIQVVCELKITDLDSGDLLAASRLVTHRGAEARATSKVSYEGRDLDLKISCNVDQTQAAYTLLLLDGETPLLRQTGSLDLEDFTVSTPAATSD
jgi:hypothetical protein